MNKENLTKKAHVMSKAIDALSAIYHDESMDYVQRGLLETLIGAGIWYLPNSKLLFSGKISRAALEKIKNDSTVKLVQEHGFPRKVAGNKLFNEHLELIKEDSNAFYTLFVEKFGKYNLVLKEENMQLKKFQKTAVFTTEEDAYSAAGIELVSVTQLDFTLPQLKAYRKKEM